MGSWRCPGPTQEQLALEALGNFPFPTGRAWPLGGCGCQRLRLGIRHHHPSCPPLFPSCQHSDSWPCWPACWQPPGLVSACPSWWPPSMQQSSCRGETRVEGPDNPSPCFPGLRTQGGKGPGRVHTCPFRGWGKGGQGLPRDGAETGGATMSPSPGLATLADIVGGRRAQPQEFPFLASIQKQGRPFCAGALVHPGFVLTAASCFRGK